MSEMKLLFGEVDIPRLTPRSLTASYSSPDWRTVLEGFTAADWVPRSGGLPRELPTVTLKNEVLPDPLLPPEGQTSTP